MVDIVEHALSVLGKQALQIRVAARLQQRQTQQHPRLLRVVFHRRHEPQLVVVKLHVAADDVQLSGGVGMGIFFERN